MSANPLFNDLNYIVESVAPFWEELKDQHIFITGGTGLFGCWLLESFIWANEKYNLNAHATVLTRNFQAFQKKCPVLATHPTLSFIEGDVKNFVFPEGHYSHIIHAATEVIPSLYNESGLEMLDTIIEGTKHTLKFAKYCRAKRLLFTSSGAVYGKYSPEMVDFTEDYSGKPRAEDSGSTYGIGKYMAEHLCHLYQKYHNIEVKIARCFAVVGPYLPIHAHFAIGNFIRDAMLGQPIIINGDGTSYRSYLYTADLTIWLWRILFCGQPSRPYNVGSNKPISIAELARFIAEKVNPKVEVIISKKPIPNALPERYVPDTARAQNELGLIAKINLNEAIEKTVRWHEWQKTLGSICTT